MPTRTAILISFIVLAQVVLASVSYAATAEPEVAKYMNPREPRRLALLIGNYEYANFGDLPGVKADLDKMTEKFRQLKFDVVTPIPNLATWEEFQLDVLKSFRRNVDRDDLVVIYFSGHGFTFNGYQYFVPSKMPARVHADEIDTSAIPIETLPSVFQNEGAGGVLLIVDACRTVSDLTIAAKDGSPLPKGPNNGQRKADDINYVVALSVGNGLPSEASSDPNVMSAYSGMLLKHIGREEDFRRLHDQVEYDVKDATRNAQRPGLLEFTMTDIVLSRGPRWLTSEQELWESVLREGSAENVRRFIGMHSLNAFVRDARAWLAEHHDSQPVRVPFPPIGIDQAWQSKKRVVALKSPVLYASNWSAPRFAGQVG